MLTLHGARAWVRWGQRNCGLTAIRVRQRNCGLTAIRVLLGGCCDTRSPSPAGALLSARGYVIGVVVVVVVVA